MQYGEFVKNLLPLGTRVKLRHPNMPENAHCTNEATIVAYFITAIGILTNERIISEVFPYRLRFDVSDDPQTRKCFPKGYEAIFSKNSVDALEPASNIFPNDAVRIMGRMWLQDLKKWTNWQVIKDEIFAEMQKDSKASAGWEFSERAELESGFCSIYSRYS